MAAINVNGQVVNVGDEVSCPGTVVSASGSGFTALVTVQTPLAAGTVVAQAKDMNSTENVEAQGTVADSASTYPCSSFNGNNFGKAGDQVTILGTVTAISGSGNTALLTVKLVSSGNSISIPAGACSSAGVVGGTQ